MTGSSPGWEFLVITGAKNDQASARAKVSKNRFFCKIALVKQNFDANQEIIFQFKFETNYLETSLVKRKYHEFLASEVSEETV